MINNDRIVPVTKSDLLSLYGTIANLIILAQNFNGPMYPYAAKDVEGNFLIETEPDDSIMFNQPIKSVEIVTADVSGFGAAGTFDYHFEGFKDEDGNEIPLTVHAFGGGDAELKKDGWTLYAIQFSAGAVLAIQVTP